jgi:hypothetical protein
MEEHIRTNGYHETADQDVACIGECIDLLDKVQNETFIDDYIKADVWTDEAMMEALKKHNDTRKLLFKTIEKNIERWWD